MNIKSFLKLVEIQTKVASMVPLVLGILFTLYRYDTFRGFNILIFFVSLLCIDMATTTINNYMDYRRAIVKEGYNYERHNAIVAFGLTENIVKLTIGVLLFVGMAAGLLLVYRTDLLMLVIGMAAFAVGILYSTGPIPISRTPYGEIFSGFFMGGLIFFVTIYLQIYDQGLIIFRYSEGTLHISLMVIEFLVMFLVAMPMIAGIANIMLANNICDINEDVKNRRFTLPYFIGIKPALSVFAVLYYIAYMGVIAGVILGVLPLTCLLTIATFPLLQKGILSFKQEQKKEVTFVISVQNFMFFSLAYGLSLGLGVIIQSLLK